MTASPGVHRAQEINFDGLIGPTHHYGGLSLGNVASSRSKWRVSHPKQAALQGLEKMRRLMDLGVTQGVLPPQPRPDLEFLREQGYDGTDQEVLEKVFHQQPDLLSIAASASSMWAANAATVSPSADCMDGRVHFTPANLQSTEHRRLESPRTTKMLRAIFRDANHFVVHDPLPIQDDQKYSDEGAANHMRLCDMHGECGLEVFVYGRDGDIVSSSPSDGPQQFPARQTLAASRQIARQHGLVDDRTVFARQSPQAIDAGVFHNDVIAVANRRILLVHEGAFVNQDVVKEEIQAKFAEAEIIEVSNEQLSLDEVVKCYLFNSQLLTLSSGETMLLCPLECQQSARAARVATEIVNRSSVGRVEFVDVRQSMANGGGPACLRLRVVLTDTELTRMHQGTLLTDQVYDDLVACIRRFYPEELSLAEIADIDLYRSNQEALKELEAILGLVL